MPPGPLSSSLPRDQIGALTEGTTGIVQGDLPFERPLKHLDCGLSLIDLRQPMVVVVVNRNTLEWDATNLGFIWLGAEDMTLDFWAPHAGQGVLSFDTRIGPSLPETPTRHVRLVGSDGRESAAVLTADAPAVLPLTVRPGLNSVRLRSRISHRPRGRPCMEMGAPCCWDYPRSALCMVSPRLRPRGSREAQ